MCYRQIASTTCSSGMYQNESTCPAVDLTWLLTFAEPRSSYEYGTEVKVPAGAWFSPPPRFTSRTTAPPSPPLSLLKMALMGGFSNAVLSISSCAYARVLMPVSSRLDRKQLSGKCLVSRATLAWEV